MKKIIVLLLTLCMTLSVLCVSVSAKNEINWNLMNVEFANNDEYDPNGMVNVGVPTNSFAPQAGKDVVSLKKEGDINFVRVPSLDSGNALLEGTIYSTLEARDITSAATADVNLVMQVRFRAESGATGLHFRIGSSNYRTVVDCFINGRGNLCAKISGNIISEGVNDGKWHTLTITAKYSAKEDSIVFDCDEDGIFDDKFSNIISRTDAPIMTVLLLKEPGSDPVDIDYVKVSDGGEGSQTETTKAVTTEAVTTKEETTEAEVTTAEATAEDVTTEEELTTVDTTAADETTAGETTAADSEAISDEATTDGGSENDDGKKSSVSPWIFVAIAAAVIVAAAVVTVILKKKKA